VLAWPLFHHRATLSGTDEPCLAPQVNRAFLERCNEVETTFEMSGRSESAPASTAAEGEASPGTADVQGAETNAARKRAAEIEHDRQQGVVYYEAYRTLGRLQTFVWINTKGFQKIMKKYDKRQQLRGTGNELGPDFEKRLEKEAFCSGKLEVLPLAWLHSPCPYSLWLYLLRLYLLHSGARGALQAAAAHGGEQQCHGRRRRRQAADATPRGQRQP
jgi:hypothetical protein